MFGNENGAEFRETLLQPSNLIGKNRGLNLEIVFGASVSNLSLGEVQFRLREFNNRAESKLVAALCKVKRQSRLLQQLGSHIEALIGCAGIEPGGANIAPNAISKVAHALVRRLGAQIRFLVTGGKQETVKDRNIHVDTGSGIAVTEWGLICRRKTRGARRTDRGHPQIALGARIAERSLVTETRAGKIRPA